MISRITLKQLRQQSTAPLGNDRRNCRRTGRYRFILLPPYKAVMPFIRCCMSIWAITRTWGEQEEYYTGA